MELKIQNINKTALDYAKENRHSKIVEILSNASAPTKSTFAKLTSAKSNPTTSNSASNEIEMINEISVLKEVINKLHEENESKSKEINELKAENSELQDENESKDKEINELIILNSEFQDKNESKSKEISKLKEENSELQDEIESKSKEINDLKAENSKLQDKNELNSKEINQLKAENTKLRKEVEMKNEQNQELQNNLKELEEQISSCTKQVSITTSAVENKKKSQKESNLELLGSQEIDQLKIVKQIGRGSQSDVYEVIRENHYVLKVLLIAEELDKTSPNSDIFKSLQRLLQEYEILHLLKHRNIINSFGFFYGDEHHSPSILLEYCPSNLAIKIASMNDIERVCAIIEICLGMEAVHSSNMIHRDLKPENILIDETGHVKLSDFGIACIGDVENPTKTKTSGVGTLKFMAPELLQENTHYTNKVDVYSFGVVVFFILTGGQMPKISIADQSLGKQAPIPSNINEISCQLIKRCWSKEEKDRPSFSDIIEFIKINNFQLIDGVELRIGEIRSFTSI